jgi:hypothetical protein
VRRRVGRNNRTETYGGIMMVKGDQPAIEARALQGLGITDRLELTAGGFGSTYQGSQARPLDLLIQPKYVLHNPLGALRVNMSETLSCIEFTEQGEKGFSG